jgi:hypothetical protein
MAIAIHFVRLRLAGKDGLPGILTLVPHRPQETSCPANDPSLYSIIPHLGHEMGSMFASPVDADDP